MTLALIRWHEAFQIFEPEIMLEELYWDESVMSVIPWSIRWRRIADDAAFIWLTWPSLNGSSFTVSVDPVLAAISTKASWIDVSVVMKAAPHVILALVLLELNERFPVDAGS
jgi:hypothetical protein